VPFGRADGLAEATLRFLSDAELRTAAGRRAFAYAAPMRWPNVGREYMHFFREAAVAHQPLRIRRAAPQTVPRMGRSGRMLHGGM
jgi:hypothetical protein